jgi:hypothetical protein
MHKYELNPTMTCIIINTAFMELFPHSGLEHLLNDMETHESLLQDIQNLFVIQNYISFQLHQFKIRNK